MSLPTIHGVSISTHAPRTGSDLAKSGEKKASHDFNPRSPHGERRYALQGKWEKVDISTHAPRTGSDDDAPAMRANYAISTHAPRTGSDRTAT